VRAAALELVGALERGPRVTLGADKGYDTGDFVDAVRLLGVTPHVAQNTTKRVSAIDGRTTRHAGYAVSQRRRKRVEEIFGWLKTVGLMRKTRHRGTRRVDWMFTLRWPPTTWFASATSPPRPHEERTTISESPLCTGRGR
jgi:Transposase DDE domain